MRATLDHFEIPVANSDLVASFLEAVFGWSADDATERGDVRYRRLAAAEADPVSIAPPMRVGLYEGPPETLDRPMPVVRITGEALELCLERVVAAGGNVLVEPQQIAGSGRFARFEDPEGNPWGLWQPASS